MRLRFHNSYAALSGPSCCIWSIIIPNRIGRDISVGIMQMQNRSAS